jgi:zinc-binding alcohol dehydrogenase family protein
LIFSFTASTSKHVVDERIAAHAPKSLTDADAAALPLTAITAWEMLFHRLGVARGEASKGQSLLIIGAAGGVESIMTQLARQLTGLTVIGTASRPETARWVRELGAHHVLDHDNPLAEEIKRANLRAPHHVVSLTQTEQHFAQIAELIAPQGKFGLIDDPAAGSVDIGKLKRKSVSLHWELMFTRSLFETPDMVEQHRLLSEVARLVDAGQLRSTKGEHFGPIVAANLKRAHALLESGKAKGKIVLEGFRSPQTTGWRALLWGTVSPRYPATPHPRSCCLRILLVEDDPALADTTTRAFKAQGWAVDWSTHMTWWCWTLAWPASTVLRPCAACVRRAAPHRF